MFCREQNTDDWHVDIEDAILEKCKNNNGLLHIFVDRSSKEVKPEFVAFEYQSCRPDCESVHSLESGKTKLAAGVILLV